MSIVLTAALMTHPMIVDPPRAFVNEDVDIKVSVGLQPQPGREPTLVEVDENGNRLRTFLPLVDNGILGDRRAGDGLYARKFKLNERSPKKIRFSVAYDEGQSSGLVAMGQIEINHRPSFVQVLKEVWKRLFGQDAGRDDRSHQ